MIWYRHDTTSHLLHFKFQNKKYEKQKTSEKSTVQSAPGNVSNGLQFHQTGNEFKSKPVATRMQMIENYPPLPHLRGWAGLGSCIRCCWAVYTRWHTRTRTPSLLAVVLVQFQLDGIDVLEHVLDDEFLVRAEGPVHLVDAHPSVGVDLVGDTLARADVLWVGKVDGNR